MTALSPGFGDAVRESQACFRAVLDAMAGPGGLHTVSGPGVPALDPVTIDPVTIDPVTAAVVLTLVDQDAPLFLHPAYAAAAPWIRFHCGAPLVEPGRAAFALMPGAVLDMAAVAAGTDEAPEDGATIIVQVTALGAGPSFRLHGPGLQHGRTLQVTGLPGGFIPEWAANAARFPRGIDLILCAGHQLTAFPRTIVIEAG